MRMGWAGLLAGVLMIAAAGAARAQDPLPSFGGYGAERPPLYAGGTTAYLPLGGSVPGYVPYSGGPGGGLATMPASRRMEAAAMRGLGMPGPRSTGLGLGSARLVVPGPIGRGRMGMRGAAAMGGSAAMSRPSRPPVGAYPFRRPAASGRPAPSAAAMSM
jgi:hypothetical protein